MLSLGGVKSEDSERIGSDAASLLLLWYSKGLGTLVGVSSCFFAVRFASCSSGRIEHEGVTEAGSVTASLCLLGLSDLVTAVFCCSDRAHVFLWCCLFFFWS